jgi:hypothetical protein
MTSRLAQAVIFAQLGLLEKAAESLRESTALAHKHRSKIVYRGCTLLDAHLSLRRGDTVKGASLLAEAFATSREHGLLNPVWISRSLLGELCEKAIQLDIETQHVRTLASKFHLAI